MRLSLAGPGRTGLGRAGPSRAGQGRAGPDMVRWRTVSVCSVPVGVSRVHPRHIHLSDIADAPIGLPRKSIVSSTLMPSGLVNTSSGSLPRTSVRSIVRNVGSSQSHEGYTRPENPPRTSDGADGATPFVLFDDMGHVERPQSVNALTHSIV